MSDQIDIGEFDIKQLGVGKAGIAEEVEVVLPSLPGVRGVAAADPLEVARFAVYGGIVVVTSRR